MRAFPSSAHVTGVITLVAAGLVASLVETGCNQATQSSAGSIADAVRAARENPESSISARIKGVVSFADSQSGDFVVEDSSGGVRLALGREKPLHAGELVDVAGLLQVTGEAGVIIDPEVRVVGTSPRPPAIRLSLANLHGNTNRTVAVNGIVESVETERSGVQSVLLRQNGKSALVSVRLGVPFRDDLMDGRLEVTGVLARGGDTVRAPLIWSRNPADVKILQVPVSRGSVLVTSVAQVLRIPPGAVPDHRIRLQGDLVATSGKSFRLTDGTAGIWVRFNHEVTPPIGEHTDLLGFLEFQDGEPCLEESDPTFVALGGLTLVRSARELHALPYRVAAHHQPVRFRAVVTYAAPPLLFVQDTTDGVFAYAPSVNQTLKAGDLVDLDGNSVAGDFAPSLGRPNIKIVGRSPLPAPDPDIEAAFTGKRDSRWVQFQGVVQQVAGKPGDALLSLVWGPHKFKAHVSANPDELKMLLDCEVDLRGVIGTLYNDRRQFLGVQMFIPGIEFITIRQRPVASPAVRRSIRSLLQFSALEPADHRVTVEGVVTLSDRDGPTWVRDDSGGLVIVSHAPIVLHPGDLVSVLGFAEAGSFGPAMRDASIVTIGSGKPPQPIRISADEAIHGTYESQLVEIEGTVVNESLESAHPFVTLRANPYLFGARLASVNNQWVKTQRGMSALSPGAHVLVRGIVSAIVDRSEDTVVPRSFQISMRSPEDLVVLRAAPWLTTGRLGLILAGALLLVFGSVCWILMLRRSVGLQTLSLLHKTRELEYANQIANDALNRARGAEAVEGDRKAILELVAKDEPLEYIMQVVCEAAARHLGITACSVQLNLPDGSRVSATVGIAESAAAVLSGVVIESPEQLAGLPRLNDAGLGRSCAAVVHRGQKAVGFLMGFDAAEFFPTPAQTAILESWSNIASLAVERRGFFDQLFYRARHDSLTGLMNRESFYERLGLELARSAQTAQGLSLVYLDLDDFKNINDRHGHDAGDAVLQEVSRRLRDSVRRTDFAARLGGDEFVVLLPGVDNRNEAGQIGKLIRDALHIPVPFGAVNLETGGSLGIAVYPDDGIEAEALLKSADQDMYRKKSRRQARSHEHGVYV